MRLTHDGSVFVMECLFSEKDLPKRAGFRWDPVTRRWTSDSPEAAEKFRELADGSALEALGDSAAFDISPEDSEWIELSRSTDTDWPGPPIPDGLELFPFQRAGVAWLIRKKRTLLADPMGVGKTVQAIGAMNELLPGTTIIACPPNLTLNWERELDRWLIDRHDWAVARITHGKKMRVSNKSGPEPKRFIVILPYSLADKWADQIETAESGLPWDLLVLDEAHQLKNPTAKRTRAVFGFRRKPGIRASRVIAMTGTPILNKPSELWNLLHYLDPRTWSNRWAYLKRYCDPQEGQFGMKFDGGTNLEELQRRLRTGFMMRRSKQEVLPQLPKKRRQVIEVPAYNEVLSLVRAEGIAVAGLPVDILRSLLDLDEGIPPGGLVELAKLREQVALAKVPAVLTHVRDMLDEVGKIVVFAHHRSVVRALFEGLAPGDDAGHPAACVSADETRTVCRYDGTMPQPAKDASVSAFVSASQKAVFVGSIQAAGTGLNLQCAEAAVFAESTFVPSEMNQAEDRIHRIGSTGESILIQHVVLDGSLDARLARRLIEKQALIDAALDL